MCKNKYLRRPVVSPDKRKAKDLEAKEALLKVIGLRSVAIIGPSGPGKTSLLPLLASK